MDDVEDVLDIVYEMVTAEGYEARRFNSGAEFLKQSHISEFGCLLLDNQMPGMTGLDVQNELIRRGNSLPIVFMSGESKYTDVVDAVREGALHFLQKPFTRAELLENVAIALRESEQRIKTRHDQAESRALVDSLTGREKQVYQLVTAGLTNKAIARELDISNGTVEFHRANMMKKLGVKSLADLMAIARACGDENWGPSD